MWKRRFSEEQIAMTLRQAESGTPVDEICRKLGVSEGRFDRRKKRFGSLGVPDVRERRQRRDENRKLKQLVAAAALDKTILHEALQKVVCSIEDRFLLRGKHPGSSGPQFARNSPPIRSENRNAGQSSAGLRGEPSTGRSITMWRPRFSLW